MLRTLLVVREYLQSHVDVEDFKATTSGFQKKSIEKSKKRGLKDSKRKKGANDLDRDDHGLENFKEYTPLNKIRVKIYALHKNNNK